MFWIGLLIGLFIGAIVAWFTLAIYLMATEGESSIEA